MMSGGGGFICSPPSADWTLTFLLGIAIAFSDLVRRRLEAGRRPARHHRAIDAVLAPDTEEGWERWTSEALETGRSLEPRRVRCRADGKPIKTPTESTCVPTRALADALPQNGRCGETIDPRAMPLTGLPMRRSSGAADHAFAEGSPLRRKRPVCYRAEGPRPGFNAKPKLGCPACWARRRYDVDFATVRVSCTSPTGGNGAKLVHAVRARNFTGRPVAVVTIGGSLFAGLGCWRMMPREDAWEAVTSMTAALEQWGDDPRRGGAGSGAARFPCRGALP